ncbi:MAG: hypothetical protein GTO18_00550 [Anaerolineales bacterium]|nr:hypothetical protein [Anaerolineales bacterium]
MSNQILSLIVGGVLFLHGLAHVGPVVVYVWIKYRPDDDTGGWQAA